MAIIAILILFLCSCDVQLNWNPQGDWIYPIQHGYCIVRVNNVDIKLCVAKPISEGQSTYLHVVDEYIISFSYNDSFIAVKRLTIDEDATFEEIMAMDVDQAQYYLVNAENRMVFGPFAEQSEFDNICTEQDVGTLGEWIDTYPAPSGAEF